MRVLDPVTVAAALVLVPSLAWWLGRFAGQRNMPVMVTVIAGMVAAIVIALAKAAVIAAGEGGVFADALARRVDDIAANPEFLSFLITFGVFMAMLSWSATPAAFPRRDNDQS